MNSTVQAVLALHLVIYVPTRKSAVQTTNTEMDVTTKCKNLRQSEPYSEP